MNDAQGLAELVEQVRKAMTTEGFFYVINHGYTQDQVRIPWVIWNRISS